MKSQDNKNNPYIFGMYSLTLIFLIYFIFLVGSFLMKQSDSDIIMPILLLIALLVFVVGVCALMIRWFVARRTAKQMTEENLNSLQKEFES